MRADHNRRAMSAITSPRSKLAIVLLIVIVMATLLILNVPWVNGPSFWPWPYRPIRFWPVYAVFAAAAAPLCIGLWIDHRYANASWIAIGGAMISCFALKVASVAVYPTTNGLELIEIIVENPDATSYYTDAAALSTVPLREWMPLFPHLMPGLNLHSKSKPPGPILYWLAWISALGYGKSTAFAGGLVLGAIATLSIPATYQFLKVLLNDSAAALCGASYLSLCPGFVLFFPMFDPTYILLSTAMIGGWCLALRSDRVRWSIVTGAALAATCVITFNALVIGIFMIGLVFFARRDRPMAQRVAAAARHSFVVLVAATLFLGVLWLSIGYDPIATFRSAWNNQHDLLRRHADQRPYPATILFDLYDFALGSGWMSFAIVAFFFITSRDRTHRPLAWLAVIQLVAVAALGLLQIETARVWNFMLPLLMIPVGLELSRWPFAHRLFALAALTFATAAVCQNLKFIY